MSGGHFNYEQFNISDAAEDLQAHINKIGVVDESGDSYEYPDDVVEKFREGVVALRTAFVYLHRIDWLISGDDGDEAFLKRLEEDLEKNNGV